MTDTAPAATSVDTMRNALARPAPEADHAVDFFSARGFALAQRIATALATSNAVPTAFRSFTEKKDRGGIQYIENPAALGNCLVAIETARAVGMSITAVMQNANVIEGRLTWSAQYKIGAINASRRFTPLRFDIKDKGPIKAKYREKLGWNDQKRGFDFREVEVEVDNLVCIAWALPGNMAMPSNINTLDDAKKAGLPVIESAPVSMKLAVEEGWYGKAGSKWQTEMKHLMLQYRAGSFFGNIHAPDIVNGMGRTSEELEDITTVDVNAAGNVVGVTTEELRKPATAPAPAEVVNQVNTTGGEEDHPLAGSTDAPTDQPRTAAAGTADQPAAEALPPVKFAEVAGPIAKAATELELAELEKLIARVEDAEQQAELNAKVEARRKELAKAAEKPASRRAAAKAAGSVE